MMLKVFINVNKTIHAITAYSWDLFAGYAGLKYSFTEENPDIIIGDEDSFCTIPVSHRFLHMISSKVYDHTVVFGDKPYIAFKSGKPDILGTAFYMINSLQEYPAQEKDEWGRFPYRNSYQSKFDCAGENLVARYFDVLIDSISVLKENSSRAGLPSRIFLSHDNDTFYGSFLQDGLFALKKGRIDILLRLLINEVLRKPAWFNLDRIMDIENEYDVKSTFFWLVTKDKLNADYDISSPVVRSAIKTVGQRGFGNGLHKSIGTTTFSGEMLKLDIPVIANRNHFLKITLPRHYQEAESAGIKIDSSLGFAEVPGFRNNYGLPFRPFDLEHDKARNLVEVPLHLMDTTFHGYQHLSPREAAEQCISFLKKNHSGCVLTILWHNNFFSDYKYNGFFDAYKEILSYMRESGMKSISQEEILETYAH